MIIPTQLKLIRRSNRLVVRISNLLVELILLGAVSDGYAQGLVNFFNTSTTLVSVTSGGVTAAITEAGSFYFALLTADPGTTDPSQFRFSGVYATNLNVAGRIFGGMNVPVPGWEPGTLRWFMVCGWDARSGPTFDPAWLTRPPQFEFGMSPIASGIAGGFNAQTGENPPPLNIFGAATIWEGFLMPPVCLSCNPPEIRVQPQDQFATAGTTVQFMLSPASAPWLICQWFCNGAALAGATNLVLELTNVGLSENGNHYYATLTNPWGSVMSATATLTVTPRLPVDVRSVPGLAISGGQGISLEVMTCDAIGSLALWSNVQNVVLTTNRNWWFDLSDPSTQRFYRTAQNSSPSSRPILELHMVPAITLTGAISSHIEIAYAVQSGPTNTWLPLATVLLTNTPQLYFDTSAVGQPRIYGLIPQ